MKGKQIIALLISAMLVIGITLPAYAEENIMSNEVTENQEGGALESNATSKENMETQSDAEAEIATVTKISLSGAQRNSKFYQGRIYASLNAVYFSACSGLMLKIHNSDGTETEHYPGEWEKVGIQGILKNKSTGAAIALDNKIIPIGTYELTISYQGYSLKACEFTISTLADSTDKVMTIQAPVDYEKSDNYSRNTVTKFIPESDGSYSFKIATDSDNKYFNLYIRKSNGEVVQHSPGKEVSAPLKGGESYYITVEFPFGFQLSVTKETISKIEVAGEALCAKFYQGKLYTELSAVFFRICSGLMLEEVYSNGTSVETPSYQWQSIGVVATVKDKSSGKALDLSKPTAIPIGNYEVTISYRGMSFKACDFQVLPLKDMVDQTLTTGASVSYDKASKMKRDAVTKFVPEVDGKYTFTINTAADTTYLQRALYRSEGLMMGELNSNKLEFHTYLRKGEEQYLTVEFDEQYTVSVKEATIVDKQVVDIPTGKQTIFKTSEGKSTTAISYSFLKAPGIKVTCSDKTSEVIRLNEVMRYPGLRIDVELAASGMEDWNEILGVGVYHYLIWFSQDTSVEEDINIPFYVYNGYNDVNIEDWYHDYVAIVSAHKIMSGLNTTTFGPADNLARAQFALILYRMSGSPKVEYKDKFKDVPKGDWYTDAVIWASDNKIVTGYSDSGLFGVGDKINREQMAVMMYRYAKFKEYNIDQKADLNKFKDANSVNAFAKEAMIWAAGAKIITGTENETRINPQGNANRAECATIIMRFIDQYEQ